MDNPFKFGTIVEEEYFTDRVKEVAYIKEFVNSAKHLVIISPRRFGKSSMVTKAVKQTGRKYITVNMQQVTSVSDMSAKLLREFFKVHPLERVRHLIIYSVNKVEALYGSYIPDLLRVLADGPV